MIELSQEKKEEIVKILKEKGIKGICPMCGNNHFVVGGSYFNNTLQDSPLTVRIGGPSIPTIPVICSNCGYVSQHALGVLGLLPKEEKKNDR